MRCRTIANIRTKHSFLGLFTHSQSSYYALVSWKELCWQKVMQKGQNITLPFGTREKADRNAKNYNHMVKMPQARFYGNSGKKAKA